MTATKQDIGFDNKYYDGDTLEATFTITGLNSLTGASVSWAVTERENRHDAPLLTGADADVDVSITDASAGEVTVTVDGAATEGWYGTYYHELRVTDSNGRTNVVSRGAWRVESRLND